MDLTTEAEGNSKFFLASKTIQANLVLASATELFPSIGHWVSTHPQSSVLSMILLNLLMRSVTSDPLHFKPKKLNGAA